MSLRTSLLLVIASALGACDQPNMSNPPLDFAGVDGFINPSDGNMGGGDGPTQPALDAGPDVDGPTIVITLPTASSIAGGVIKVQATITDPSGVDDKTVQAVFTGNLMFQVSLSPTGNHVYEGSFDVRKLGTNFVFPSVSVRADDLLGNHGDAGLEFIIDNVPPTISLDPPKVQASEPFMTMTGTVAACSAPFDPVGDESANDGKVVQRIVSLKARIEDHGNSAPGELTHYIAALDPNSALLAIIPTGNGPLVVDSDNDGICDELNPLLIPTNGPITASDQSIELNLVPLNAGGKPDFSNSGGTLAPGCGQNGEAGAAAPPLLCDKAGTTLTYVLMNASDPTPEIFSIPAVVANDFQCIGLQFDSMNRIGYGKACAAVVAADKAGNVGVSSPLRFCIDDGASACTGYTFTATDCTGKFDPMTNKVVAGTCTPKVFPANEVVATK
jgi:hypothetical protein